MMNVEKRRHFKRDERTLFDKIEDKIFDESKYKGEHWLDKWDNFIEPKWDNMYAKLDDMCDKVDSWIDKHIYKHTNKFFDKCKDKLIHNAGKFIVEKDDSFKNIMAYKLWMICDDMIVRNEELIDLSEFVIKEDEENND